MALGYSQLLRMWSDTLNTHSVLSTGLQIRTCVKKTEGQPQCPRYNGYHGVIFMTLGAHNTVMVFQIYIYASLNKWTETKCVVNAEGIALSSAKSETCERIRRQNSAFITYKETCTEYLYDNHRGLRTCLRQLSFLYGLSRLHHVRRRCYFLTVPFLCGFLMFSIYDHIQLENLLTFESVFICL